MYLVSNIIVKVLVTSVRGWFVESFGIVGIPTLAFNPLHSWLSIDHHSLLQVALCQPESQKPRQRVSNADRKVFANLESFCDKFIIG